MHDFDIDSRAEPCSTSKFRQQEQSQSFHKGKFDRSTWVLGRNTSAIAPREKRERAIEAEVRME